jgi:dCTP deaminase
MILVDRLITERAMTGGDLTITNFVPECVQPASYDLRLGNLIYSPSHPDEPRDLSINGGAYRLPPYGAAFVATHEDLRLPTNLIGRIGLKSGYARTGLVASTGPQIDPGYNGKLFVSLFNLTAAPHVLKYLDPFLTIEFHTLDELPSHGYQGPYQGKYNIGPEVMEALVRLEGLTLSQMQSQFTELAKHVERWRELAGKFDEFLSAMNENTRAIRELISPGVTRMAPRAEIEPQRKVSLKAAAEEILNLFQTGGTLYYSDIAEQLNIDLRTAIRACQLLEQQGLITGAANGSSRSQKSRRKRL